MFKIKKLIISNLVLLLFAGFFITAYGESITQAYTIEDATVDEDRPDTNIHGDDEKKFLKSGWGKSVFVESKNLAQVTSYLKFDLDEFPKTDFNDKISINSVDLDLLVQSGHPTDEGIAYLITVNSCQDNKWNENQITWNTRICGNQSELNGGDFNIIESKNLPGRYEFDVTKEIKDALENNRKEITFIINSVMLPEKNTVYDTGKMIEVLSEQKKANILWIWSGEGRYNGIGAPPTLNISYTESLGILPQIINLGIAVVLPVVGIIVPVILWTHKQRKK